MRSAQSDGRRSARTAWWMSNGRKRRGAFEKADKKAEMRVKPHRRRARSCSFCLLTDPREEGTAGTETVCFFRYSSRLFCMYVSRKSTPFRNVRHLLFLNAIAKRKPMFLQNAFMRHGKQHGDWGA